MAAVEQNSNATPFEIQILDTSTWQCSAAGVVKQKRVLGTGAAGWYDTGRQA